jgi:hypothetical protein
MTAWHDMEKALEKVFGDAVKIPFTWDESIKRIPRAPVGVLSLGQSMTVGRDGHRYTFRDSDVSLDVFGYRELTINVQIRARLAKSAPSSRILAEKARLSLANPTYRQQLKEAGLVFVETHPLVNIDFSRSVRKELRSSFDVVFRTIAHEHLSKVAMDYFDQVIVSENLQ